MESVATLVSLLDHIAQHGRGKRITSTYVLYTLAVEMVAVYLLPLSPINRGHIYLFFLFFFRDTILSPASAAAIPPGKIHKAVTAVLVRPENC